MTQPGLFDAPPAKQKPIPVAVIGGVTAKPAVRAHDPQKAFDDAVADAMLVCDAGEGARPSSAEWIKASGRALALGKKLPWVRLGWLLGFGRVLD